MKFSIHISKKWRKLTAVLLLLNFFVTPLLNAFPQEECNGVCEVSSAIHECRSEENTHMEMSCCDMMEMNYDNKTTHCGMELSDINCALISHEQVNQEYIIPKTIDNKVDFVILPLFNIDVEVSSIVIANYSQDILFDSSPPIYLMIASFLN